MTLTPVIYESITLLISLIKLARDNKALSGKQLKDIRRTIQEEFDNFPEWKDLR